MAHNLKMFERLGYVSIVLGVLQVFFMRGLMSSRGDIAIVSIVIIILLLGVGGLIWAAACGHRWAGWLLVVFLIWSVLGDIGVFWSGGPAWFQDIFGADASDTIPSNVIGLLSTLLLAAALYFYFLAASAPSAASTTGRPRTKRDRFVGIENYHTHQTRRQNPIEMHQPVTQEKR
jgi:hypothetical protein